MRVLATLISVFLLSTGSTAQAQDLATPTPVSLHPWQASMPQIAKEAYFTNLKDGDQIETPFRATFGLSGGWGLAPISKPLGGKSGHHHLLVNRDLPLDFKQPLPFTDKYIHFGKGQMESVLSLPAGDYTLRLLLADHKHLPHFVYSKPLRIKVTRKNENIDPPSLVKKGISLQSSTTKAKVNAPFRVQFHASGLNVAHSMQQEKDTGHFRLSVIPQGGGKPVELIFTNGQTETWLAPPASSYKLKLDLLDNINPGKTLAETASTEVLVE